MPVGERAVYPRANPKMTHSDLQGGFTAPGVPLLADSVTVDAHTPLGSVNFTQSAEVSTKKQLWMYGLAGLALVYYILRQ